MRARRGMALVMALTLLALLGLAIAGALASTVVAQRTARVAQDAASLDAAADYAVTALLGDPATYGLADLRLGASLTFTLRVPQTDDMPATLAVTRLRDGVLWIVATVSAAGAATRRVNLVARFPSLGPLPAAPIVTRGNLVLHDVTVSTDTAQDADCAAARGAAAIVGPAASIDVSAGLRVDTSSIALDSATYYLNQRQLAELASSGGVTHVAGDTTIEGGTFDGVLVVDGSLTLHGAFSAAGLIIVRGSVDASSGTLNMRGAFLIFGAPPKVSTNFTRASIEYAPCVVSHALRVAMPPHVVRMRSWAELF